MNSYSCSICGAGCYSADETKTICAECVTDKDIASMKSPEEIREKQIEISNKAIRVSEIDYTAGWEDALDWVLGVEE